MVVLLPDVAKSAFVFEFEAFSLSTNFSGALTGRIILISDSFGCFGVPPSSYNDIAIVVS